MPLRNRRILTPMWNVGEQLFTFKGYQQVKLENLGVGESVKRVWVGIDLESVRSGNIDLDSQMEWVFDDHNRQAGYDAVQNYNRRLLMRNVTN